MRRTCPHLVLGLVIFLFAVFSCGMINDGKTMECEDVLAFDSLRFNPYSLSRSFIGSFLF